MSGAETRHRSCGMETSVEEHCIREEAELEGTVDCMEERMPE